MDDTEIAEFCMTTKDTYEYVVNWTILLQQYHTRQYDKHCSDKITETSYQMILND